MEKTVLISLEVADLQRIIIDAVNTCLKYSGKPIQDNATTEKFLSIKQAAELLNLAVPSIYGLVHRSMIPYMKRNKRLYFSEKELLLWIKSTRHQTNQEIRENAAASLYQQR
jgi:predicted DNA-binding transcriptional regulator AlpA